MNSYHDFIAVNAEEEMRATRHLDLEQRGVLSMALLSYWQERKPLPASDRAMAAAACVRVGTWRKVKPKILPFLKLTPEGYIPSALSLTFQRPGEEFDDLNADVEHSNVVPFTGRTPE